MEADMKCSIENKQRSAPPVLPPMPLQRKPVQVCRSLTREEIDRFWRQKRMQEEEHLLAAIKAAARIRARKLMEDASKQYMESSYEYVEDKNEEDKKGEIPVGMKDWWTKSKYAYLNQPAIQSMDAPKRRSSYTPYLCHYNSPPPESFSLGVF